MKGFVAAGLALILLGGCATDATIQTTSGQFAGEYYSGDGLGRAVTVVLRPDHTFESDWQGCLGVYGTARGTWQLQGDQLVFAPVEEDKDLVGFLRQATTIRHDGRLGFARSSDVKGEKVNARLVFLKQPASR
ncbi:YgdI/YgdR family lipoprotein [Lysobacter sp. 5GHs7-4]|uniref:YgdI/YgdR family lipoprotein n=1 Tax=Lysobacter sp. 5GHs7-4 TaxID=2904253 RepID=UPI001E2A0BAC|nr:YgdI/YgdR family lipoprotein [Lysobacter sp. 5GHs7-4]UHQ23789.1 YgdI/YgdR family lipoprotein [Lysobacter sp. 5GHs7-4]